MTAYQSRSDWLAKSVRELYLDKVKGIIGEVDFVELSRDFTAQRERLQAQVRECRRHLEEIDTQTADGSDRERIAQYVRTEHLTREMVEILIDRVMVGKRIAGTRNVPIEVHWNF